MIFKGMKNEEVLALATAKLTKDDRAKVTSGKYAVNFTVHIEGEVKVGEGHSSNRRDTANLLKVLAILAKKVKETTLKRACKQVSEFPSDDYDLPEVLEELFPANEIGVSGRVTGELMAVKVKNSKKGKGK